MKWPIRNIAILGRGTMGESIAAHLANSGFNVKLLETMEKTFEINDSDKFKKGRFRDIYDQSLLDHIEEGFLEDNLENLKEIDLIIEAVLEVVDLKKDIFEKITPYIGKDTILSTNTSGLSINEIGQALPKDMRDRFLGIHFFNPPRYMKLVELIPNDDTDGELTDYMVDFITDKLGKGVIIAKDTPSFISNRVGVLALVQTMQLAEKYGINFKEVDELTGRLIGRSPAATFRTGDMVGLDILKTVAKTIEREVDDEEAQKFILPGYVDRLIEIGNLGDKSKQGFFKFIREERKSLVWNDKNEDYEEVKVRTMPWIEELGNRPSPEQVLWAARESDTEEGKFLWEVVRETIAYCLDKVPEITDDFRDLDLGLEWGYNHVMGPFKLLDQMGPEKVMEAYEVEGVIVPSWAKEHLKNNNGKFYKEEALVSGSNKFNIKRDGGDPILAYDGIGMYDMGDGIALMTIRSRGSAINSSMYDEILEVLDIVERDFDGLVISGEGRNFCAGADLVEVANLIKEKDFDGINNLVAGFQNFNMKIRYLGKPVVAAPYGMTLGGGMEMCMNSTAVVAHGETRMGLVESGVGVVPAGGGTVEMARQLSKRTFETKGIDYMELLLGYWRNLLMAKTTSNGYEGYIENYLEDVDKICMNKDHLLEDAKNFALGLKTNYRPNLKKPVTIVGRTGYAHLKMQIDYLLEGRYISDYDALIASKLANIICGGDKNEGDRVSEDYLLDLEREAFVSLTKNEKTLERIEHMLKTGKPLRN